MNDDAKTASKDLHAVPSDGSTIRADEVLVFDSSTFIREIGLMSTRGSALKHYLYRRETQLVVPQAAVEEYERHLARLATGKIRQIQKELRWLAQFFGRIPGWSAPDDDDIASRARALAKGDGLEAIVLPESDDCRERAQHRNSLELPPAHLKAGMGDCRIWEQCLDLLSKHDVVFVAADRDFQSHGAGKSLHPLLSTEAAEVGAGRSLTFHSDMPSLLHDLRSEIPPISDEAIFEFIYNSSLETIRELHANTMCRPTRTGAIEQTRLATEDREIIEIRLQVEDRWDSPDGATSLPFELSGSCRYHLGKSQLFDLTTDVVRLTMMEPDGSVRSVKGSRISLRANASFGAPPIDPQRGTLE